MKQQKLYLMFLIVIFCLNHKLGAQWIQTNGPSVPAGLTAGSPTNSWF